MYKRIVIKDIDILTLTHGGIQRRSKQCMTRINPKDYPFNRSQYDELSEVEISFHDTIEIDRLIQMLVSFRDDCVNRGIGRWLYTDRLVDEKKEKEK